MSVAVTTILRGTLASMSSAPRPSIKRSVSLGFALLALCLGCSDGSDADHGGAHAGAGGAGGAGGASADGGHAGSRACDISECLVANTCLDHCGGTVVYTGCCECAPPAINKNSCAAGN
jgi:hypothetical protein